MRLLIDHGDNVTLEHVGHLFSLSLKYYLFFVGHALFDVDCEGFCFIGYFAASTLSTILLILTSFAFAAITSLLHLKLHESHVLQNFHRALSLALFACYSLSTFSSRAFALRAVHISIYSELLLGAFVKLFQSYREIYFALRTFHSIVSSSFVSIYFVLTLLVIDLSFYFIRENFICTIYLCKLFCGVLITYKMSVKKS